MSRYYVWVTLTEVYEADSEAEAENKALDAIAERDGMDIHKIEVFHEVTP